MSTETKTPNTRVTYIDGHTDEVCVSIWQRCQAETHAKAKGWGSAMESVVKLNTYATYVRCRQLNLTALPFEQWADTVASVEDMKNDDEADEYAGDTAATVSAGGDTPGFPNGTQVL